jgi:putative sterol carrier protein
MKEEDLRRVMASLPGRFRPRMAGVMVTAIQFEFTGDNGGSWFMRIHEGKCEIGEGAVADTDATVRMSAADFVGINDGTVRAPDVFWSGRIDIEGSVDAVLALPPVMGWD